MFGNKKNKIEEQIRDVFSQVTEQRESFEQRVSQIEAEEKHIFADVSQVLENTGELSNHAMYNIEEESALIHSIDDFSRDLRVAAEKYSQVTELVRQEMETITELVEANKHFTSPSKYLTEVPMILKQTNESYEKQLSEMAEYGRQMGVMALNAAIEAGRMGEGAKQFVNAAEEIRQTALVYERAAVTMKEELVASQTKVSELEDTIHRLVGLLKDSNMGTARLLKKCQETNNVIKNASMRDFSDDMILMRDKVVAMRNLDEEIAKCAERNQIQLCDIQDEVQAQRESVVELESDFFAFD